MDFSWFDGIVGILILLLAIRGVMNGFIREFFGLAGIVGGVYVASVYSGSVGVWISANVYAFKNPSAMTLIGFLVLLVVIWVSALLIAEVLQKLVRLSALSAVDRLFGFVFGALKVFVIFSIIIAALTNVQFVRSFIESKTQNSYLYPMLKSTGEAIIKLDFVQDAKPVLENLDKVEILGSGNV
ncbi:CvpA family protein [Helicobacter sp.]|uniref:CvpA family protein n=1 Tax=Helicobacter sp. TaxID=218 RepID=UPI0025B7ED45|nr:CvpA family protein [Helicobacter sp.]MCI5968404.1 CvpA family protein [Helicobacter sp.]MDY2585189.1 CvpA family protein [Helicobacter sp.]